MSNIPSPEAAAILEKVIEHILTEPTKFDMFHFVGEDSASPCGTSACIAGFVVFEHGHLNSLKALYPYECLPKGDIPHTAERILGVECEALFYTQHWPHSFRERHLMANGKIAKAEVAADRIRHFINTGE